VEDGSRSAGEEGTIILFIFVVFPVLHDLSTGGRDAGGVGGDTV
jgi:hypothetical protein